MTNEDFWETVRKALSEKGSTGLVAKALAEYGNAFYDRSREPVADNALGVRYGDLLPYYGAGLGFDDARRDYEGGNYGQAALGAAMTAIPWGGLIRKGGANVLKMNVPKKYYPTYWSGANPIHEVKNWAKVRSIVRAAQRGEKIPPIIMEGPIGGGALITGTHRAAANDIMKKIEERTGVAQPYIDFVEVNDLTDDVKRTVLEAIERGDNVDDYLPEELGGLLKREMVAYHGTPHQFDEFKMDKIGTGEGFQSEGHGLYFSEAPEVAEHYKASFSDGGGGNVYRAAIPDKEKMLDWDARLSEQPAIKTLLQQPGVYSESIRKAIDKDMTGEGLYQTLQLSIGKENASRFLNSVGIPGARYLDKFSRAGGGGTHNFVVWDESRIKHLGEAE